MPKPSTISVSSVITTSIDSTLPATNSPGASGVASSPLSTPWSRCIDSWMASPWKPVDRMPSAMITATFSVASSLSASTNSSTTGSTNVKNVALTLRQKMRCSTSSCMRRMRSVRAVTRPPPPR